MDIALFEGARANLPAVVLPYVFHYIQYADDGESCVTNAGTKLPPAAGTRFEMTCSSSDSSYNNDVNVIKHNLMIYLPTWVRIIM